MSPLVRFTGLPLLDRELTEQAARRRTWVVRTLCAAALLAGFAMCLHMVLRSSHAVHPLAVLGSGHDLHLFVALSLAVGILLVMPAMVATVVSGERERGSLDLLLISGLGPSHIVFEKLVSRMVPALTFLLLGAPLMAVAFVYGGVTVGDVVVSVTMLVAVCVQTAAVAMVCSAWSRTVVSSLVASYLWVGALQLPVLWLEETAGYLNPVVALVVWLADRTTPLPGQVALRFAPAVLSAVLCLWLARVGVSRRCERHGPGRVLRLLQAVDRGFGRLNRLFGNVVVTRPDAVLLDAAPLAWKESRGRSLGRTRYLVRAVLVLAVPVAVAAAVVLDHRGHYEDLIPWTVGAWALASIAVLVSAVNMVAAERTRKTLDVLLVSPLECAAIMGQKIRRVHRVAIVAATPLVILATVEVYGRVASPGWRRDLIFGLEYERAALAYLVTMEVMAVVHLAFVAWLGCWIGVRAKTRRRGLAAALFAGLAINILPVLAAVAADVARSSPFRGAEELLLLLSPLATMVMVEAGPVGTPLEDSCLPLVAHLAGFGVLAAALRLHCRRRSDRHLGRVVARRSKRKTAGNPGA